MLLKRGCCPQLLLQRLRQDVPGSDNEYMDEFVPHFSLASGSEKNRLLTEAQKADGLPSKVVVEAAAATSSNGAPAVGPATALRSGLSRRAGKRPERPVKRLCSNRLPLDAILKTVKLR